MKDYQFVMARLFREWSGEEPQHMTQLAPSGSDRRYFRIFGKKSHAIGAYNADYKENLAFIGFTRHFHALGLSVPELYAVDLDQGVYLQEDLGDTTLFQLLPGEGEPFSPHLTALYKSAVEGLAKLQIQGSQGLDYQLCYPRSAFDRQSMMWDLNYFKHYFLKLARIPFDEQALEDDFQQLCDWLLTADSQFFLFRDFQSRNIMIRQGRPFFIDYQGGRRGALQYDLASLLYQAKSNIPPDVRREVAAHYLEIASEMTPINREAFLRLYEGFVLIRGLQTLGAYGFRGLFERKEHFLTSIPFAIRNIRDMLREFDWPVQIPELRKCLKAIVRSKKFEAFDRNRGKISALTVRVNSFSYRSGIPQDPSGNGGGFVFDCRFIFNPGRSDAYKHLTGRDEPVIEFLRQQGQMEAYLQSVFAIVDRAVENYIERDFEHLMVSFGCTGGQHRSVYAAEATARHLHEKFGVRVALEHIEQEKKAWKNG